MPGSIHVSVLEAFDLPEKISDGKDVAIKVSVGKMEYQTAPSKAIGGKTTSWNLDFVFPVLNLRDNLLVMLVDDNEEAISKSEIDTPSIVEQGSFGVNLLLNGGGKINLRVSFVLTDEERRRIDVMRAAALKRREQEAAKLSANMQSGPTAGEMDSRSSESTIESFEKDNDKHDGANNPTPSQELKFVDENKPGPVPPQGLEGSLVYNELDVCDKAHDESTEATSEMFANDGDKNEESCPNVAHPSLDNESPLVDGIAKEDSDSIVLPLSNEAISKTMKSGEIEIDHSFETLSEENRGAPEELSDATDNGKLTPKSVKDKIRAFETTRPQGASYQSLLLSAPSGKLQKVSLHDKTFTRKRMAERVSKEKVPLHKVATKRIEGHPLEAASYMAEPNKRFFDGEFGDRTSARASEPEVCTKQKECLHEVSTSRTGDDISEPTTHTDHVEPNEGDSAAEKSSLYGVPVCKVGTVVIQDGQPKNDESTNVSVEENKNTNLLGISLQVLSGAVVVVAGVLLWAANPNKRNSRLHQRSKQRKRK